MSNREISPTAKLLIEGRKYLDNPKHWTQHRYVKGVLWWRSYCAVGWLYYHKDEETRRNATHILHEAAKQLNGSHLASAFTVNDCIGHQATLKMYDLAIQIALNQGGTNEFSDTQEVVF